MLKRIVVNLEKRWRLAADRRAIARGVREGWLTPARARTKGPPPRMPVAPFETIMRALDEDREDR